MSAIHSSISCPPSVVSLCMSSFSNAIFTYLFRFSSLSPFPKFFSFIHFISLASSSLFLFFFFLFSLIHLCHLPLFLHIIFARYQSTSINRCTVRSFCIYFNSTSPSRFPFTHQPRKDLQKIYNNCCLSFLCSLLFLCIVLTLFYCPFIYIIFLHFLFHSLLVPLPLEL